ncbi:hemocytin [Anthonomus grandis grandis]|uniref:hemocytin n=1 Tax=Anthonomus grandis grandis TaxID=2921223 RepID=UPI0021669DF2|nr:hemocytin [Anthonomus grandis grandis]
MGVFSFLSIVLVFFGIFLHHISASQIPQFLVKKYGLSPQGSGYSGAGEQSQYGSVNTGFSNTMDQPPNLVEVQPTFESYGGVKKPGYGGYGVKTMSKTNYGTKFGTKYGTKFGTKTGNGFDTSCGDRAPSPGNAGMRCSKFGGCKANCIENYMFPNGNTEIMITCQGGVWKVVNEPLWESVPSCEPICLPPCQNKGICMAPNQCRCEENFSGPQCQFENKPCLNLPPLPTNSRRTCRSRQCTIECMPEHTFPDGSSIAILTCHNGMWLPAKHQWKSIPDCRPTCSPPCKNGGTCLSLNVCQCPQEFRGPQCQFSTSVCKGENLQFNGMYNCSGDMESVKCTIACPDGTPLEFTPESQYTCQYSTGIFEPSPRPQCIYGSGFVVYSNVTSTVHGSLHHTEGQHFGILKPTAFVPPIIMPVEVDEVERQMIYPTLHTYNNKENAVIDLVPKPGSCFSWAGTHYKTFDGKVYSFDSQCGHVLVKDSVDNTFSIITQNHPSCYKNEAAVNNCYKIIKIFYQDKEYFLKRSEKGLPIFGNSKKLLSIPGQEPGLRVTYAGLYVVLSLDKLGVVIKWDGLQILHIEVQQNMWNRTQGLCGNIDGTTLDDFIEKDGHHAHQISTFASSWKVDNLEYPCDDLVNDQHICSGEMEREAELFCKNILSDIRFAACTKSVNIISLLDSCKWDYCACKETDRTLCICETLEVYVKECTHKGIKDLATWRDEKLCPMKCSNGKTYMSCGPKNGQQMCGDVSSLVDEEDSCVEGCYCPEGTVLHDNKCILKDQCPCTYRGKSFPPGASISKKCNTCSCVSGKWECTQVACGARCAAIGDPHYETFDGKKYDFMGQCTYYLVKADDFSIEAENVACAGSISQAMNFPASVSSGLPSCTKTVTLRYNGQVIKLKQNHDVVVNGLDVNKIPYNVSGVYIRAVSSIFLQVDVPNGVKILWDGVTRAYIDMPASFRGKTRGLCGTFNDNQKDDFVTPENDIEETVIPFANKWKTNEKCNDVPEVISTHPCYVNLHNKATAEKYCSKIKGDLFKDCHWFVDPEQAYKDCLYDMCSCELQMSKCLCPTISAYAAECARQGVKIDWRNEIRECGIHCPGGQKYQICGNSCSRTCSDLTLRPDCKPECVEGCNCPEGQALDGNGECIPIGQCPCQQEGLEFQAGYKEVRPGTHGLELCTCLNANWNCRLATQKDILAFPRANDLKAKCDNSRNFEFTTCEDVEPVTCKNMHTDEHFSPSVCHAGCKCKDGYVLDSKNKRCVKPNECPCHHGGKSYKEKSIVQSDCNTCTCKNGKWKCTDRQCTAECSTWGDSHYKTFDGKHFDYQGQCTFVLAKGVLGSDSFDVTIESIPCGSLGTSCSKSVTVRVSAGEDTEKITLTRDKPTPRLINKKHITLREKGIFVILEAPDLGLVVHWDKGTRVYVKIDPRWKNKIKGLCGNYNDNEADDFQTPSGGMTEASAKIFGDSWRLQDYCSEALDIEDTCAEKPERKVWALKKCGVLKSKLFAPCHSEVPLDSYFDRCVFDACSCDQGDDCHCLCTALASYAQECNNKGAPVRWRSQQLCPIQCDQRCSEYSSCISTCPLETCDNLLTNSKLSKVCSEDSCIEGCSPKPCPPDYVYLNESYTDCVPRNICKPVCMEIDGETFYEGDLVEEDDCHSCYCSRGTKVCKGQPCTTPATTVLPTIPDEQKLQCINGWTNWINQFTASNNKRNLLEKEPLPLSIILNDFSPDYGRCPIEKMVSIECLTVDGRNPKELGLDVECSLERGLICKSSNENEPCPDFKIRVLCECEKLTTVKPAVITQAPLCDISRPNQEHQTDCHKFLQCVQTYGGIKLVEKSCGPDLLYNPESMMCDWKDSVLKIKPTCQLLTEVTTDAGPECPPGLVKDECAIECDKLCGYYLFTIKEQGLCHEGTRCEAGCVANQKTACPKGHLWLNENSCVPKHDCLCLSNENKPVKPGPIVQEEPCKECQCIDNYYTCHQSDSCKENVVLVTSTSEATSSVTVETTTPQYFEPSVSPPPECTEDRMISLIQNDQPLPDSAFSASSTLSESFSPKNARLDSKITEKSGGSWSPQYASQDEYLEVDFGQQEPVYGVIIRGSPLYDEYVTSYMIQYSPDDGTSFYYVLNQENPPRPQIFRGSIDATTPVKEIFSKPFEAKRIRIRPQTWHTGISLRMEIIGCSHDMPTTTISYTKMLTTLKPVQQLLCDDEMGIRNGSLVTQQISVSSEKSSDFGRGQIRLNSDSAWQPLTDSTTEWVEVDFLESRDITGIVTKGGPDGWVTAYSIKYSQNGVDWNPIVEEKSHNEQVFLGNFDSNSPEVRNFIRPINARYLKLIPIKWQNTIQLRLEIHGCFKPYPTLIIPVTTEESRMIIPCNNCPGVEVVNMELDTCRCLVDQWFDGTKCVNRTQCPCMVGHIAYEVGSVFEKEDCSECICKLGGVSHCNPKHCVACKEGLRSVVTSTCQCTCQPCPEGTILCPTSGICINSTLWCNGIQDCPDDEVNCQTTSTTTEILTTTEKEVCPEVKCQPGYKVVQETDVEQIATNTYLSPLLSQNGLKKKTQSTYSWRKFVAKSDVKSHNSKKQLLSKPLVPVKEELICPVYKCVINKPPTSYNHTTEECPKINCPPGFIPVLDGNNDYNSKLCPVASCYPQPLPDAICNITGRTFNTFDDTEFKYDICNHVIARDLQSSEWQVSLKKNCSKECSRDLVIVHNNHDIIIRSDMSIRFNDYEYTAEQIKNLGAANTGFSIVQLGNTLMFTSSRYGFWIIWNKLANVKFGVSQKLSNKVDGLCGFFDNISEDDKRKPDGTLARTTADFGDSWALDKEQPAWCEAKACPIHIQNQAWEMCNKVKEQPLSQCATSIDIEAFVSRCLDSTCSCLERAEKNHTASEECRCNAMQSFVVDCLSADSSIDLSDWRMQQDCPATCESPLVYNDCFQRKCEPTCESIADPYVCPKVSKMCFPGCYCPPGFVRKDDSCIKPSSCRDCECNVLPHLQYITYDESNFTVNGNCVYVMSRDALMDKEDTHKWQVLITNHPCKNKPEKMCVGKITILYQGHKVHILVDHFRNRLKLIVDSERVADFEEIDDWAQVKETRAKHMKFLLTDVQVEVSVYYPSLGVSVKAPSHKYGGKLEGLCGNCNKNPDDDMVYGPFDGKPGGKPKDVGDFALSWLYENLPGGQTREGCENLPEETCAKVLPENDPCMQLLDLNKFGQCLNVMDPSIFIDWCKKDTCNNPEGSCAAVEAFARDCAAAGFCVNWRNEYCPAQTCGTDQHYEPCAQQRQTTCEDIKDKKILKGSGLMEGCYCEVGKVLLNDTCILPKDCEICDDEGHHPGDVWKKNKCTTCRCEGLNVKCDTQYCPGKETICERGYTAIQVPTQEDTCCEKYACVPEPTAGPTCEPPQKLICANDQVLKLDTKPNGCQTFICECKPKEECLKIEIQKVEALEPGMEKIIDENGCCPLVKLVCNKDNCPRPTECPQYYVSEKEEYPGQCCPTYTCKPPKEKCIFETSYGAAENGGERLLTKYEKQTTLKNGNETWQDGPCRDCKCILTSGGTYQAACSETECPLIEDHSDFEDYELKLVPVPKQCCPKIERSACKFGDTIYEVGTEWQKDEDYCTTYKCIEAGNVKLETSIQKCEEKDCKPGYKYAEPNKDSKECCGKCVQVACIIDDVVRNVGEEWTSADHCTNYFCVNLNGSLQVEAVKVNCPVISEDDLKDFAFESHPVEGQCCKEYKPIACKVKDKVYEIGETWPSPDGDKCKTVTCKKHSESNQLSKEVSTQTCTKNCSKGWEYIESTTECCGKCVQTSCILSDSELKKPNETWMSEDGCKTYSCSDAGDQLVVTSTTEGCPYIGKCPKENIYKKGCCYYCNATVEKMTLCSPQPIQKAKTVGMIVANHQNNGKCVNKQPIRDFTECIGTCHSSTFFSTISGLHESICSCCQAVEYQPLEVELTCEDGFTWIKKVAVPAKCECVPCGGGSLEYPTKEPRIM